MFWPSSTHGKLVCPNCHSASIIPSEIQNAKLVVDQYRRLLVQSPNSYFEIDAVGCVTSWNSQVAKVSWTSADVAVGQFLEDIVSAVSRNQVKQAIAYAQCGSHSTFFCPIRFPSRGQDCQEVTFRIMSFHSSEGKFLGAAAIADTEDVLKMGNPLPDPVNGVIAWCACFKEEANTHMFNINLPRYEGATAQTVPDEQGFRDMIEKAVQKSASFRDGPTVFDSEVMPYEMNDGATRYFQIRAFVSQIQSMPFSGEVSAAEGYVVDVTNLHKEQQERAKWHERWREMSLIMFDFVLLLDITEYRLLHAWGDTSQLGQAPSGRLLFEYVSRDDKASMINVINSTLSAPCGATHVLNLKNSFTGNKIRARCTMMSDNWDPSQLMIGVTLTDKPSSSMFQGGQIENIGQIGYFSNSENTTDNFEARGSNIAREDLNQVSGCSGQLQHNTGSHQAASSGKSRANDCNSSHLRLTATTLGLVAGMPLPFSRAKPNPAAAPSKATPHQGNVKCPIADGVDEPAPAAQNASHPVKSESQCGHPRRQRKSRQVSHRRRGARSRTCSYASSHSSGRLPRVYTTQVVLHGERGAELWRSASILLGENLMVADFCTPKCHHLLKMPMFLAQTLRVDTHELFVVDDATGELLQVVSSAGTTLGNLLPHGSSDGKLEFVVAPVADSEDAFEACPIPMG